MHSGIILIVEDEESIIEILRLYLEREGYIVYSSLNVANGLKLIEDVKPDIVLLDIHLPDKDGFELARKYREQSNGILIFITGKRDNSTIIKGFEIGCDDYITKPFEPTEIIARLRAITRRSISTGEHTKELVIDNLKINFTDKNVYKHDKQVELFTKERLLLFFLAQNPNQVFSAEQLFDAIWGINSEAELKTVSVHLSTLRKKIEDNPKEPKYIQTVRGFGYKFSTAN